ncbi:MAG: NAD(P)-binding domain-containing protein, partial [Bacteroidales bacterium]
MEQGYDYGMIGLGTMGRNLVYNMCDHGYAVAGYDKDIAMVEELEKGKGNYQLTGTRNINQLIDALKTPRIILLLVPAGSIVDAVIQELIPLLSKEDVIIDC